MQMASMHALTPLVYVRPVLPRSVVLAAVWPSLVPCSGPGPLPAHEGVRRAMRRARAPVARTRMAMSWTSAGALVLLLTPGAAAARALGGSGPRSLSPKPADPSAASVLVVAPPQSPSRLSEQPRAPPYTNTTVRRELEQLPGEQSNLDCLFFRAHGK